MSSSRSSRKRKARQSIKDLKTGVRLFKFLDPLVQGLLFVFFLYSLDITSSIAYQTALWIIVGVQAVSCIVNYILNPPEQQKGQRTAFFCCILMFAIAFFCHEEFYRKPPQELKIGETPSFTAGEVVLIAIAIALLFWYNLVCFLEISKLEKRLDSDGTGTY